MTDIRLYNSLTRSKETFEPIDPSNVRMYVCGPTVYDRAHIGNARPAVVFDVLYRLLRHAYGADHVAYVRNITDIEDKIMARASETGRSIQDITDETSGWYLEDMKALGCLDPTHQPRATQWVPQMVAMIEQLIEAGKAYEAEGHVLFEVKQDPNYGRLSGRSTDDMIAGARVEVAPYKRDPMDFVLWKPSTGDQPGWDSPWGLGRPGWHIECSAMSHELLGPDFDIHGGGADLQFPHHENELAQSTCAHPGSGFARYWMHNNMIRVEGEKMSKSLGNFITVEDLRGEWPGEVIRFAILSSHYRQPLDWTSDTAASARKTLIKWRRLTDGVQPGEPSQEVVAALSEDLNMSAAIARMHGDAKRGNAATLLASASLLGLLGPDMADWGWRPVSIDRDAYEPLVRPLIDARLEARSSKDFETADRIRNELLAAGVSLKDSPEGTEWSSTAEFDADKLAEVRP